MHGGCLAGTSATEVGFIVDGLPQVRLTALALVVKLTVIANAVSRHEAGCRRLVCGSAHVTWHIFMELLFNFLIDSIWGLRTSPTLIESVTAVRMNFILRCKLRVLPHHACKIITLPRE